MPSVERPDGVQIHWETRGAGPRVVIVHQILWSYPAVYEELIGDLARDHQVLLYDARGCGHSTRRGPYDAETDAADLEAVVAAAGGAAVAIAVGYGYSLAIRVAATRPDLISHMVAVAPAAAAMLPRHALEGADVMAASDSVIEMLVQMMSADPRAALRTIIAATNTDLDDEALRDRVERVTEYIAPGVGADRARAWLEDDPSAQTRMLGDRLWILHGRSEPLFEGVLADRVAQFYPQARIEELEAGPISRPDLFASRIRQLTQAG